MGARVALENQRITGFPQNCRQLGRGSLFPALFPPETNVLDWTTVGLIAAAFAGGADVTGIGARSSAPSQAS